MRGTLARTLAELAKHRDDIVLLTADLGFMALEPFSDAVPSRFINAGVSEQNMIGVATGLASAGLKPYAYSIATFAALRPFEFIRNGPVLHDLPVRIVGVGAGYEYGAAGPTHHCLEDIAVFRPYTNLTLISPADSAQARTAFVDTVDYPHPIYFRLSKDDKTVVPGLDGRFSLGHADVIREGAHLAIVSIGLISAEAVKAAALLAERGIEATIVVVSSLNPSPDEELLSILHRFDLVLSVEEHYVDGGLGSLLCELNSEHGARARVVRCGVRGRPTETSGEHRFYLSAAGLTADKLADRAESALSKELA